MPIQYIAGYQFISLKDLSDLKRYFLDKCQKLALKGTILLSEEGININLSGEPQRIETFLNDIKSNQQFSQISFRKSMCSFQPFKRLKIKIKKEIITLRQPTVKPTLHRASSIQPDTFKQWLDEKKDITVLDTRNDYEIDFGTFTGAMNLQLKDFCEFSSKTNDIPRHKPIVMFCTGGIRCEKAALHLMNEGFSEVYQLEGGILNYFETVGNEHYHGSCFVFDERIALDTKLTPLQQ